MAMQAFDPSLQPSRELEIDIWREANLMEAYASSRQGLALAADRRGFDVRTQGNVETVELLDRLDLPLGPKERDVARTLHEDLKARCRAAGIPDEVRPVAVGDVQDWLASGWVPLVLVDSRLVGDEALPHWVVVTRLGGGMVRLNDPLATDAGTRVDLGAFRERLGFEGTYCAVIVEGQRVGDDPS